MKLAVKRKAEYSLKLAVGEKKKGRNEVHILPLTEKEEKEWW